MGVAYFPNGIRTPLLIGGPSADPVVGNVFFVGATASGNWIAGADVPSYGSYGMPFATLDYAIGKCTANQGDVIYLLPGHTETIAAAGGVTCDVAGISIIGLGNANLRPTFTWSATASSWLVTAANVTIKNILCYPGIDEVVSMFAVSAAGCTMDAVDLKEGGALGATYQARQFLLTTADADQLTIKNCDHRQFTAAGAAQVWIDLVGTNSTKIVNNTIYITANASTSSIAVSGSTTVTQCEIAYNRIIWLGGTVTKIIALAANSTGVIYNNYVAGGSAVLLAATITGDACFVFNNYATNTYANSGTLAPTVADVVT